ncbi:MAG: type I restriction-modification system subunit M [Planctomycetota bacterium]|jgi:type I restriction enzyme M protein
MSRRIEETLWRAADKLRGQLDAASYKHVVLGLVFLRHISLAENGLRVPAEARWNHLSDIDEAFRALEASNPALRGVLPRGLERLARVDELLDLVGELEFEVSRDSMGRIYEYFLAQFARAEGRRGGQFYTPRCIVDLLVAMLGPLNGTIYDPCCGSGGMFVQAGLAHGVFGQESNPSTWRLARMNLGLHGIEGDLGARAADSFLEDLHEGREADIVLANPPFNQSDWGREQLREDRRWRYGLPPDGVANFAWIQHILSHLRPGGRAGIVLANGSMSATKAGEGAIRTALVEQGLVDCVVALPSHLFFSTQIPACIWILSTADSDRTLFIDARETGRMAGRTLRELTSADIGRIAGCYRAFRSGGDPRAPGFAAVATRAELAALDHVLTPGRHVPPETRQAVEPDRLRRLQAEWERLAAESERLSAEIREAGHGLE